LVNIGKQRVYDVQTTDEQQHLVVYNGLLTHQSVAFGLSYGRGAKAIALAAKEQGVSISVGGAQQIIDAFLEMYPRLEEFFDACRARATEERWLCNPFGRLRRVPLTSDPKLIGDFERQFLNCPMQSLVADAVSRACDYLYEYRTSAGDRPYRMVLQIHDALLLEVPGPRVPEAIQALQHCMVKKVPIYPTDLDGNRLGTGPFYMGVSTDVCTHWGEKLRPSECLDLGFSPKYAHWSEHEGQWGKWDAAKKFKPVV
jgi:hypothetical protein